MGLYNDKHRLFADYVNEMNAFAKAPKNEVETRELCEHYISSSECTWKNIFSAETGELVGFLILGKTGAEKHPDADRSIAEAYMTPDYRKKGLMKATIVDYESRHHCRWSMLVQKDNQDAQDYFAKLFEEMGYVPCELDASKVDASGEEMTLLGFKLK
ncbi:MAG: GNAT family N-acetyltransferase [Lachnospiraceae bacterium]|nr:GNAT family N-acetyltransferase [Lachnospiraceae bacterium]